MRVLHAIVVVLAFFPWALGCLMFAVALGLVLLADRIWPDADWGNCWSFVGPRWYRHGGYIAIRSADEVSVSGCGPIPHAMWITTWPADAAVQQTRPRKRTGARWLPWRTLYFPYVVKKSERPHNSNWADL